MQGLKIAIGGKGGVGKTTVCAIWARLFAQNGFNVLAIDADPNSNLASAFGLPAEQTPEPLIEMKELIAERTGTGRDAAGSYFKLNPKVSDLPEKYWIEADKVKLLILGAITQAGSGCACPEGAFLKALLSYTILQRQEVVLIDLAAGVEFMGRASIQGIDALVLIAEPGSRSIETVNNMAKMSDQLGIKCTAAIVNKITENEQFDMIKSRLENITILGNLNYSRALQQADLNRKSVFDADAKITAELEKAKIKLEQHISGKNND